jgi:multidrug efflux pump subunit AcrA (membrane-fusion protein)
MTARRSIGSAAALSLLLGACGGGEQAAPPPPDVTVAQPERRDVRYFQEFPGNTRAIEFANVRARIPGTLDEQRFEASSVVERGQLLFVIEPEPYQASYDEAEASLASARSQLARSRPAIRHLRP